MGGGGGGAGNNLTAMGAGMAPIPPMVRTSDGVGGSYDGVGRCGTGFGGGGGTSGRVSIPSLVAYCSSRLYFVGSSSLMKWLKVLVMGGFSRPSHSGGNVEVS